MIERTYNVPLRSGFRETAIQKKTKKAVATLKIFLAKHMKVPIDNVYIGMKLNNHLWNHGIKNPPHHVKVSVVKEDDNIVKAELFGHKYAHKKKDTDKPDEKKNKSDEKATKPEVKDTKPATVKPAAKPKVSTANVPKAEKAAEKSLL